VTNPWIAKYIFPGGYIPALSEVLPAVERAGLLVTDIEILRLHYAETLKAWRERFLAHREEVERLYDARFTRMWEFYLAASEMPFREQAMMVFQLQLTKRQGIVPMTRDYIVREEARLRALEGGGRPPLRLAGEGFCPRPSLFFIVKTLYSPPSKSKFHPVISGDIRQRRFPSNSLRVLTCRLPCRRA